MKNKSFLPLLLVTVFFAQQPPIRGAEKRKEPAKSGIEAKKKFITRNKALKIARALLIKSGLNHKNLKVRVKSELTEWIIVFDAKISFPESAVLVFVEKETGKARLVAGA